MSDKITCVNGSMLKWARMACGDLQLKSVTSKIDKIRSWEEGIDFPTYAQLEELSKAYRKPIAIFFFPSPPEYVEISTNFRTTSITSFQSLSHKVIRIINEALAMQINLQELHEKPQPENLLHNKLRKVSPKKLIHETRRLLGVSFEKQYSANSSKEMLDVWRDAFHSHGIYVFKDAFEDSNISGFCIFDDVFPIIYINNSMSFTRQIFTLFHELYHLINETGGIDKLHDVDDADLSENQQTIEHMCNQFAGEVLIPESEITSIIKSVSKVSYEFVCEQAYRLSVSRQAMILRLISLNMLSWDFYNEHISDMQKDFLRPKPNKSGGNIYNNLVAYLGKHYLRLAFTAYRNNSIDIFQLASYTKTSVSNIPALENAWGWK